ncbi:hypothetical protein EHQ12_17110 [Leptospira gomenensis]|uniref:Uncharacterized protein n=1 Tax=Leptospira gomenensis TaxID=2484974 RepID=A0A5F1YDU8_9LEPT|nr:hypothetical protein [Leptospira gomenensis]TGK33801.1 hypothetical protein EHQ12_17110 [Leptospira gomenensis]TGK36370.1 hypothetical protein EHQ17_04265 [Leptospira gomenensis]TGK47394.1 hypothetical protein EHQ07_06015 [Leptospira gomenensis]TGK60657.1 hypothetical protein EHQ13_10875 [Leptospira gomenensis]
MKTEPLKKSVLLILLCFLSCTTVGFHRDSIRKNVDFGGEETLRICVWKDKNVDKEELSAMISAWNEELELYKIRILIPEIRDWERPGWTGFAIMDQVFQAPLPSGCDRLLAVAGGKFSDTAFEIVGIFLAFFGIPSFQVLGAVETRTGTRGYILGQTRTITHWIVGGPERTLIHEGYHLLGCGHSLFLSDCYLKIRDVKEWRRKNRAEGIDFFPSLSEDGEVFRKNPWER